MLKANHPEPVWQKFFAANPFVLSRGLPLKLMPSHIVPLGRPGRSEPDFLIHPGDDPSASTHGVLEIKTPQTKIFTRPRKGLIGFTRDAATAYSQVRKYDQDYDLFAPRPRAFTFGSRSHLFIVMGQSAELLAYEASLHSDLKELLGNEARLLAFDELFETFSQSVPPDVFVLHPLDMPPDSDEKTISLRHLDAVLYRAIVFPLAIQPDRQSDLRLMISSGFSRSRPLNPEWQRGITAVEGADALRKTMHSLENFPMFRGRERLGVSFRLRGKIWDASGSGLPGEMKRAFYSGADAVRHLGPSGAQFEVLNENSISEIKLLD